MRFKALRICQSKSFSVVPQEVVRYDLERAAVLLQEGRYEISPVEVMLITGKDGVEVTLYVNGRLMIEPARSKEEADRIAEAFYSLIKGAREDGSG
jgi:hypothetical protein